MITMMLQHRVLMMMMDAAQGVDDDDVPQGVGVALVSARLMAHTEIKYRQIGVLLFKV